MLDRAVSAFASRPARLPAYRRIEILRRLADLLRRPEGGFRFTDSA